MAATFRHLVLRLHAPLVAFGGSTIDNIGVVEEFPALSMVTGLMANALGWDRSDGERHLELQSRLRMGSCSAERGERLTDFQTAKLGKDDKGWTTWGEPEGRRGGPASYDNPHLRFREYHADRSSFVVMRLEPATPSPTLDEVAAALDRPFRPLFIGRKPCIPASRLVLDWIDAGDILSALRAVVRAANLGATPAQWPHGEGRLLGDRARDVCDERNWVSGVHGGWRPVREGVLQPGYEGRA